MIHHDFNAFVVLALCALVDILCVFTLQKVITNPARRLKAYKASMSVSFVLLALNVIAVIALLAGHRTIFGVPL